MDESQDREDKSMYFHKGGSWAASTETRDVCTPRRTPAGIPNTLINCGLDDRLREQQERTD